MEFYLNPKFYTEKEIEKVTLDADYCKVSYKESNQMYQTTTPYTACGTTVSEDSHYIIYKNYAKVFFKQADTGDSLITRADFINIGLECRILKTTTKTIKGKREDSGLVIGTQSVQIDDRAKGVGSFRIDFQVYKTMRYQDSYGTEEFPINVALDNRIFFELALSEKNLKLLPHNCYATKDKSFQSQPRYYIIQDRCPKDDTYRNHRRSDNIFQFSIQAFNFKDGTDSIFIHCETYVCKDDSDERCQFGCNKESSRKRRDVSLQDTVEGIMTSTLAIEVNVGEHIEGEGRQVEEPTPQASTSTSKIVYFAQIPIAAAILLIVMFLWTLIKRRRARVHGKVLDDEVSLTRTDL